MSNTSYFDQIRQIEQEIKHRKNLLQTYQENLRRLEEQSAQYGGGEFSPLQLVNALQQTRENVLALEQDIELLEKRKGEIEKGESIYYFSDIRLNFIPELSVLRSKVQYVDANLAYKFADASSDTNILLGFTTLFFGAFLSFITSALLASDTFGKTLFWTATAFCLLGTIIFAWLTKRSDDRAKEVKKLLFPEPIPMPSDPASGTSGK